jgi:hypothetical protein
MRDNYFDYHSLKEDLIEAIEGMDPNDPSSSEALVEMYNIISDSGGYGIKLHHNDIKELIEHYKLLEEDLQNEFAEDIPDAAAITSYKNEMSRIREKLLNVAKIKLREDNQFSSEPSSVNPEELINMWINHGLNF